VLRDFGERVRQEFMDEVGRWRLEEGDFVLSAGTQQVKVACEKTFVWDTPNR
jgi:beta-glucosidase